MPDIQKIPSTITEQRQIIRQLARLVEVSVTLNSSLDPSELLHFIIQEAAELLECEAASILLYDEKRDELYFTAATGLNSQQLVHIPVPLEGSLAGTIFRENHPLVINQVANDPRHYGLVGQQTNFTPRSLLGVPMCIQGRPTGVLEALNKHKGDFGDNDVHMLSVIASQAALAIHNARLHQALQEAYNELSRIDKIKSDFIAVASHELRTPLGVIMGYATFLKEDAQGELSVHAEMVLNSALRMQRLIEAMTNMNMLQMGAASLNSCPTSIQEVLQAVVDEIQPMVDNRKQHLNVRMPQKALLVSGDTEKLVLVFANLLNNAVKFSQTGGTIRITLTELAGEVRIEVRDEGFGIPPAELENIFKQFYQVESHLTRQHEGLGLGLAIARGLIDLHRGRIWAESEGPGKGATFCVTLPKASVNIF